MKIFLFILFIIKLIVFPLNAQDDFSIVLKINNKIITNHDLIKERKYLELLSPNVNTLTSQQIDTLAKQSLVKELVKIDEILKYYKIQLDSPSITNLLKKMYTDLEFKSEEEFKNHLLSLDLNFDELSYKIAMETAWNKLIYDKYASIIKVDEDSLRKKLDEEVLKFNRQKIFLLSEIFFSEDTKSEFDKIYNEIIDSINEIGFKSTAIIYSASDTSKNGGEIGWVRGSQLSKKILKKVKKLNKGEFTDVINIPGGSLIVQLNDIKEEEVKIDYEQELKKIISTERTRQLNQFSNIHYKKIKKQAEIHEN
ncbi:peptidylprolyl isomerase [Pelagibacteraceae bacterium]|nr:peptidylprolyl isomerase [Pelagibacteraceae bacterium]